VRLGIGFRNFIIFSHISTVCDMKLFLNLY
jgi:hypothetical protein